MINFKRTFRQKIYISSCEKYRITEKKKFLHGSVQSGIFPKAEFLLEVKKDDEWVEVTRQPYMRDCKLVATEMERKAA